MRVVKTMVLAAAVACAGQALVAQQVRRVEDVLAETKKALGGAKVDAVKSVALEANVQRNVGEMQLASNAEVLVEMPDKYVRSEIMTGGPMSGSGSTTGFNGEKPIRAGGAAGNGMVVIRMGAGPGGPAPAQPKLSPEEQEKADRGALKSSREELSRLMLGWFATAHPSLAAEYTFAGEAESPDGKAYVVDVRNADGFAARLFVDQSTHLPLMVAYKAPQPRTIRRTAGAGTSPEDIRKEIEKMQSEPPVMADYALYFDDWQSIEGIEFPRHLRRAMGGTTTEEWSITKVKFNQKIDAKKFAIEQ